MDFEKKPIEINGSIALILPKSLANYFEITKESELIISDDEDKIVIRKKC